MRDRLPAVGGALGAAVLHKRPPDVVARLRIEITLLALERDIVRVLDYHQLAAKDETFFGEYLTQDHRARLSRLLGDKLL